MNKIEKEKMQRVIEQMKEDNIKFIRLCALWEPTHLLE